VACCDGSEDKNVPYFQRVRIAGTHTYAPRAAAADASGGLPQADKLHDGLDHGEAVDRDEGRRGQGEETWAC
jgi:hypothetical protein